MTDYTGYAQWKSWPRERFGQWSAEQAAYFRAELARTSLLPESGLRIFEIGFGNGAFAAWVTARGCTYRGVELIDELVEVGRSSGYDVYRTNEQIWQDLSGSEIDLFVAFDVFEHIAISDLEDTLAGIRDALRVGGCVLARVPSGDSPFGRANQNGDLTHRISLGSSAVRQLAARAGLEVVDIGPPRLPVAGVGGMRMIRRLLVHAARGIIGRVFSLVYFDGRPVVMTSNMTFVLRKAAATVGEE